MNGSMDQNEYYAEKAKKQEVLQKKKKNVEQEYLLEKSRSKTEVARFLTTFQKKP